MRKQVVLGQHNKHPLGPKLSSLATLGIWNPGDEGHIEPAVSHALNMFARRSLDDVDFDGGMAARIIDEKLPQEH